MERFQFCEKCIEKLETAAGYVIPCQECVDTRTRYRDHIQKDRAYRSHLARQSAGYPCDISSHCPHHKPGDQFFQPPTVTRKYSPNELDSYRGLVQKAFHQFRKYGPSITALELLTSHNSSMVIYCTTCHTNAVNEFENNSHIDLCDGCVKRREEFIQLHHSHQNTFLEPWENFHSLNRDYFGTGIPFAVLRSFEYDAYFDVLIGQSGGGGEFSDISPMAIIFGALGTIRTFAGVAATVHYARKQPKMANSVSTDEERGATAGAVELTELSSRSVTADQTPPLEDTESASISSFHTALE
ncbi:uncharacterized protein K444DRAFT_609604 [Hyaloscypha bicolor E]|uniref:Uncharacterized protein n=1 Tax=Hyaloscypha bicolor E TaxID=1095630 RepID=A0A2J6TL97_9HELO|nr:uncharacterized protein K444DRAFT_609604 [Hyaloscypha bicolor E]PMD63789.1 hypothetical protein K444DRAFT_609604 [Hyaloscypha bicolor E]